MSNNEQVKNFRAKILGVMLYDARLNAQKSYDEFANVLGVIPHEYRDYESGRKSPSLPEIELLAHYLNKPLSIFIDPTISSIKNMDQCYSSSTKFRQIRDRIIGTRLRLSRSRLGLSSQDISRITSIPINKIELYEFGVKSIPLPELEAYAYEVGLKLDDFYDVRGSIGKRRVQDDRIQSFLTMDEDIQIFISQSENIPYLKLAIRLSHLSTEIIKNIAENILALLE